MNTGLQPISVITDDELMLISSANPELQFERDADGKLVVMPLSGTITGNIEAKAGAYLFAWVESHDLGEVFSSSAGFILANSAVRSPDAAFVAKGRLPQGWDEGEDRFLNLAPDFAIEIRSKTDSLSGLQAKMQEYIANGVKLGWLIDRQNQQAFVYRRDLSITQYPATAVLSGEDVVPGFTLALKSLL
jgi:Uma2 family endonuclease